MRILCFCIDLPGHLDWGGYLKTAIALQQQGVHLVWASGAAVEAAVTAAEIAFERLPTCGWRHQMPPLKRALQGEEREAARRQRALAVWLSPEPVLEAAAALEKLVVACKADALMIEPYAAAGALVAEKMDLPLIVVGRPALPHLPLAGPATAAIQRLCEIAGVAGACWDLARGTPRSPQLHLDFFCRDWYSDLPEIAEQTVFCGGTPLFSATRECERPQVLVTLGSTFANDEVFFRLAAESVQMVGGQALVVTGRSVPAVWASLQDAPPGRAEVRDWIDYEARFPALSAAVHHGGVATTHAALVHAVPQVVVPHAGDQFPQAARVTQAGVGYGIRPRDFTLENAPLILADAVWAPEFKENAARLAKAMHALGGPERAAEVVRERLS